MDQRTTTPTNGPRRFLNVTWTYYPDTSNETGMLPTDKSSVCQQHAQTDAASLMVPPLLAKLTFQTLLANSNTLSYSYVLYSVTLLMQVLGL